MSNCVWRGGRGEQLCRGSVLCICVCLTVVGGCVDDSSLLYPPFHTRPLPPHAHLPHPSQITLHSSPLYPIHTTPCSPTHLSGRHLHTNPSHHIPSHLHPFPQPLPTHITLTTLPPPPHSSTSSLSMPSLLHPSHLLHILTLHSHSSTPLLLHPHTSHPTPHTLTLSQPSSMS